MDIMDGLKAFVATAQTGSFTKAADRLGISNRLTSKYIAKLEDKVGTRLLQRTTRKVGLTPTGEELMSRAPALIEALDDLLGVVSEEKEGLTGMLRIAAPVSFGEIFINDLLNSFLALHPKITIDLRLSDTHVDLAAEGFDVAFRIGNPLVTTLKSRKLADITSLVVASPEYLHINGTPTTPNALETHQCIIDTNRRDARKWSFYDRDQRHDVYPQRCLLVNSAQVAKDWAQHGHGVALLPSFIINDEFAEGHLVQLLDKFTMKTHPLCAVYLEGHVLSRKVRALIDFAVYDFSQRSENR